MVMIKIYAISITNTRFADIWPNSSVPPFVCTLTAAWIKRNIIAVNDSSSWETLKIVPCEHDVMCQNQVGTGAMRVLARFWHLMACSCGVSYQLLDNAGVLLIYHFMLAKSRFLEAGANGVSANSSLAFVIYNSETDEHFVEDINSLLSCFLCCGGYHVAYVCVCVWISTCTYVYDTEYILISQFREILNLNNPPYFVRVFMWCWSWLDIDLHTDTAWLPSSYLHPSNFANKIT